VHFGVFRVTACGNGIRQPKFIFFVFKGPKANLKSKTAAQNLRVPLAAFFEGTTEMEFISFEQLEEAAIVERLSAGRSSFKPSHYEFGTGNPDEPEYDQLAAIEAERLRKEEEDRLAAEGAWACGGPGA